ncbi:type II toxin-antitoxin system RelE/ParE family toxin [Mesorhizobium sp. WSM4884]|uniref:type II toxin-antitoxin system RelE/ParE family toxin n=1 Tax=Mesorhizobium sp. WSM4884 TaxID=3038542 RepID=UPI002415E0CB|nr:type II toxin-antitoxin system RelE/ParE family toxin [Mesorhizobium sp. WSM4884]MDG4880292.1 type II toxin-antitoxin system RelE/ParE family toxin [Mesorhizobium sp. WSM4884]
MEHEVVFHPQAKVELEELYEHISERASPAVAWNFVAGIRDHCRSLSTFPARGTERTEIMPGLRIVGYRRTVWRAEHHTGAVRRAVSRLARACFCEWHQAAMTVPVLASTL